MKRITAFVLMFLLSVSYVAFAKPGDIAGNIYTSDIVAYIDGMAIPSYNIGGKTVVIAEELAPYGFDVLWNEPTREIKIYTVEMPAVKPSYTPEKGVVSGRIAGDIYETDIKAYVNDMLVESYNIGGKTAIVMEDMATFDDESKRISRDGNPHRIMGYSVALMKAMWNEEERTISLYTIRPESKIMTPYGEVTVESISQRDYRNGAYSFLKSNDEMIAYWNSAILYDNDTYVSLSEFKENSIFGNTTASVDENKLCMTTDDVKEVFYRNATTTGSCVNMLITLSEKLSINGRLSQTENSNMILYKGDIYVSLNAINSALGKSYVSQR